MPLCLRCSRVSSSVAWQRQWHALCAVIPPCACARDLGNKHDEFCTTSADVCGQSVAQLSRCRRRSRAGSRRDATIAKGVHWQHSCVSTHLVYVHPTYTNGIYHSGRGARSSAYSTRLHRSVVAIGGRRTSSKQKQLPAVLTDGAPPSTQRAPAPRMPCVYVTPRPHPRRQTWLHS